MAWRPSASASGRGRRCCSRGTSRLGDAERSGPRPPPGRAAGGSRSASLRSRGSARCSPRRPPADTDLSTRQVRLRFGETAEEEHKVAFRKITIFDTTLRDGEQSPGIALNPDEKAEIAEQLERLGADVIEAGFPISSPGDFEGVRTVAEAVSASTVAALARTRQEDIDAAAEAL